MAATLVEYAKSVSVEPRPEEVENYQNFLGEGIYGKIHGNDVYIGNKRIASRAGCLTGKVSSFGYINSNALRFC